MASAQITVVAGTYGGNLGAPRGNVTWHLAAACNGLAVCNYTVLAGYIGDPYPYQRKDYKAEWTCAGDPTIRTATLPPGVGSLATDIVMLSCAATPVPTPFPDSDCVKGEICFKVQIICVSGGCSTTTRYVRQFRMDVGTAVVP